jgi:hypothetical protein
MLSARLAPGITSIGRAARSAALSTRSLPPESQTAITPPDPAGSAASSFSPIPLIPSGDARAHRLDEALHHPIRRMPRRPGDVIVGSCN